jgi:hypothetical protein
MFKTGSPQVFGDGPGISPLGAASIPGSGLFVLYAGEPCDRCRTDLAKADCDHVDHAELVHFHPVVTPADSRGWIPSSVCRGLPPTASGLEAGPGSTLVAGANDGSLVRLRLAWEEEAWIVAGWEFLLDGAQREKLALPREVQTTFAVAPDGAIILGFAQSVVRLPPSDGPWVKEQMDWLLGQAPGTAESKAQATAGEAAPASGSGGMIVAADQDGLVLAIDGRTKVAFVINPRTKEKRIILPRQGWPQGFVPMDAKAFGRQFFVTGKPGVYAPATLVVLTPAETAGAYAVTGPLAMEMEPEAPFGFTQEGHLAICDTAQWRLRLYLHGQEAETGAEGKGKTAEASLTEAMDSNSRMEQLAATLLSLDLADPGPGDAKAGAVPAGSEVPESQVTQEPTLDQILADLGVLEPPGAKDRARQKKKAKRQRQKQRQRAAQAAAPEASGATS